jgi:hypothetical protein
MAEEMLSYSSADMLHGGMSAETEPHRDPGKMNGSTRARARRLVTFATFHADSLR